MHTPFHTQSQVLLTHQPALNLEIKSRCASQGSCHLCDITEPGSRQARFFPSDSGHPGAFHALPSVCLPEHSLQPLRCSHNEQKCRPWSRGESWDVEPRRQAKLPLAGSPSTSKLFPSPVDIVPLSSKTPSWLTHCPPALGLDVCLILTEALADDRSPGQETHTSSLNLHPVCPLWAWRSGQVPRTIRSLAKVFPEHPLPFPSRHRNFVPFGSVSSYVWSP